MIIKTATDFCHLSYDGNKMATSAHAAYWLSVQSDCASALKTQEQAIIEAFLSMANKLGYRVEKIAEALPSPAGADFHGEPPALRSALAAAE